MPGRSQHLVFCGGRPGLVGVTFREGWIKRCGIESDSLLEHQRSFLHGSGAQWSDLQQVNIWVAQVFILKSQTSPLWLRVVQEQILRFVSIQIFFDGVIVTAFATVAKVIQLVLSIGFLCMSISGQLRSYKQYCGPFMKN